MFAALPNTVSTPWDQLIDVPLSTALTTADGRTVPLKSGAVGLWSPAAATATSRIVWFSTGGQTQFGTVSTWSNMRPRVTPPTPVDVNTIYDNALTDVITTVEAMKK